MSCARRQAQSQILESARYASCASAGAPERRSTSCWMSSQRRCWRRPRSRRPPVPRCQPACATRPPTPSACARPCWSASRGGSRQQSVCRSGSRMSASSLYRRNILASFSASDCIIEMCLQGGEGPDPAGGQRQRQGGRAAGGGGREASCLRGAHLRLSIDLRRCARRSGDCLGDYFSSRTSCCLPAALLIQQPQHKF